MHKGSHQTEIGKFSSTSLQHQQVNLEKEDDLNTKGLRIGEDQDENQSKGEDILSHAVIMIKSADDAVINC